MKSKIKRIIKNIDKKLKSLLVDDKLNLDFNDVDVRFYKTDVHAYKCDEIIIGVDKLTICISRVDESVEDAVNIEYDGKEIKGIDSETANKIIELLYEYAI